MPDLAALSPTNKERAAHLGEWRPNEIAPLENTRERDT
jgi:hypothetical protein